MRINGSGAKAYDADMVNQFFEAGMGSKITKKETQNILNDAGHELRDNFEGATSSRGLTGMVNALKRTAKQLSTAGNLTPAAAKVLEEFAAGDGDLGHAVRDVKDEVAANKRNAPPPSRYSSYGT